MKKAVVIDPEVLFQSKDSFHEILERLGEKPEKVWDMVGFKEKTERLKWIRKEEIEKIVWRYLEEKLNRDANFVLNQIKGKGYKIFLINQNPSFIYEYLKKRVPVDNIFSTEMIFDKEACLGEYLSLNFNPIFLGSVRKKFPWVESFSGEPNRFGLALSLYKHMEDNEFNMEESFIIAKNPSLIPVAEFVGKLVSLNGDEDIESVADFKIKDLSEILSLI